MTVFTQEYYNKWILAAIENGQFNIKNVEEKYRPFAKLLIAYHTKYKQYLDEGKEHPGERIQMLLDGSSRSFVGWVLINIENKTLLL